MEKHNWFWQIDATVLTCMAASVLNPWLEVQWRLLQCSQELQLAQDRLSQRNRELEILATTDELTGLLNRRAFVAAALDEIQRRERYASPFALGIIDADNFKAINSCHLWPGGDKALIGVARALTTAVRATDRVGRCGGDEFMVVAPQTDRAGAEALAERIRTLIAQAAIAYNGASINVTASIGFVVVEAEVPATYESLAHAAACAASDVKQMGGNGWVVRPL